MSSQPTPLPRGADRRPMDEKACCLLAAPQLHSMGTFGFELAPLTVNEGWHRNTMALSCRVLPRMHAPSGLPARRAPSTGNSSNSSLRLAGQWDREVQGRARGRAQSW